LKRDSRKLCICFKSLLIPARSVFPRFLVASVQGAEPIRQASPKGYAYKSVIAGK